MCLPVGSLVHALSSLVPALHNLAKKNGSGAPESPFLHGASGKDVKPELFVAIILHFVICGEIRLYLDLFVYLGSKDVPGPSSAPSSTGKLAVKGGAGR